MNKTEEMQQIKSDIAYNMNFSTDRSVEFIANILHRSKKTVYSWLSVGQSDIPDNLLELLKMKLKE